MEGKGGSILEKADGVWINAQSLHLELQVADGGGFGVQGNDFPAGFFFQKLQEKAILNTAAAHIDLGKAAVGASGEFFGQIHDAVYKAFVHAAYHIGEAVRHGNALIAHETGYNLGEGAVCIK